MDGGEIMDCIFCSIADGSIPADKIYEDDNMVVFKDLNPQAPIHLLAIPKAHISSNNEVNSENSFVTVSYTHLDVYKRQGYRVLELNRDSGWTAILAEYINA